MVRVTKESLAENIGRLESYGDLSINEEYQLKAYRLLLGFMEDEELEILVERSWEGVERD